MSNSRAERVHSILSKYQHPQDFSDKKDTTFRRIAYFLEWASRNLKGEFFPAHVIARVLYNYSLTTSRKPSETATVEKALSGVGECLLKEFGLGFVRTDIGVRATFDADDMVQNSVKASVRRAYSAQKRATDRYHAVDQTALKDPGQKKYMTDVKGTGLLLNSRNAPGIELLLSKSK